MRVFIAVPVQQHIRDSLAAVQGDLKTRVDGSFSYPRPEQIHVTLHFFGALTEHECGAVLQGLESLRSAVPVFEVCVGGVGFFGRPAHPRVVWAGIESEEPGLTFLHRRVGAICEGVGLQLERRAFRPHLTLARARQGVDGARFRAWHKRWEARYFGAFACRAVDLYRSELGQGGAVHTLLGHFPFSG